MTNPNHYLIRIFLFLIVLLVLAGFLLIPLKGAFMANPGLNSFILASFLIGVIFYKFKGRIAWA